MKCEKIEINYELRDKKDETKIERIKQKRKRKEGTKQKEKE